MSQRLIIAIDFDGTIVEHEYPRIGPPVEGAIETMRMLNEIGVRIILYTMRSGVELQEAVDYIESNGVTLWAVNENPEQYEWTSSNKIYAHKYIDDAAVGVPLIFDILHSLKNCGFLTSNSNRVQARLIVT